MTAALRARRARAASAAGGTTRRRRSRRRRACSDRSRERPGPRAARACRIPPAPPEFGIDGREFTFPNEGRDGLGRDMFGVLGLLGILGRELGIVGRDMFDILGRAPPPPICPIEGLAPPPPIDGLAPPPPPIDGLPPPPPPPPPLPRWARASGTHMTPNNRVAIIADFTRMFFFASIILILIALSVYFAAVGGFLTTVT